MEYVLNREDARYTKKFQIYDYISNNPKTTEYMVVKHCRDNRICARATTHNIIIELINEDKVIDMKDSNGFHRLRINDKSEYQSLITRIHKLSKAITDCANIVPDSGFKAHTSQGIIDEKDIMRLFQVELYNNISEISRDILTSKKVTGESYRDNLSIRLINALYKSNIFSMLLDGETWTNIRQKMLLVKPNSKESKIILDLIDILQSMR